LLVAALLATRGADAAGLYASDRGVRALGRGGAFVAGADDLGAIWYNPAGLADAGTGVLGDLAWVNYTSDYTRRTQVIDSGGVARIVESPKVDGSTPFLPIPTLGASYNFGERKEFTVALGLMAPYSAISSYPTSVNGRPSPQRYSLITLDGSMLVDLGAYIAYKPIEQIRLGAGIHALAGTFKTRVTFSASPADRVISAPEDPSYDALSELSVGPIFTPSGSFGATLIPEKHVRIGLSAQLPFWINAPATVRVQLPTAAPFDHARQDGEDARVRFRLPPILRAGVEFRTNIGDDDLRAEFSYVREFWSLHDSIDIRSENIKLYDITGFPSPFGVAPISLPRGFQDSNSFRLGGEWTSNRLFKSVPLGARLGGAYETSAIPNEWRSVLTYDANKVTIGGGGSIYAGQHLRLDGVLAVVLFEDSNVDPATAKVPRVNPVKGNPTATEAVNGGTYSARAIIIGGGLQYKF
jgi:long-chain fatty acid transport protein